jgi:hypothetical protein
VLCLSVDYLLAGGNRQPTEKHNTYQFFNRINQQDAATSEVYYLSFKYSSACCGHPGAHHQEIQQLQ